MDYAAVYNQLVKHAKSRIAPNEYCERHHILPKSLGGKDVADNLVLLTAREHYVAHRLLWKIYKNRQMALAFTLLARNNGLTSSRGYAEAKRLYSESMLGDNNVAKQQHVREKIKLNHVSVYKGKRRPDHSALLKKRGIWSKDANPFYGLGDRQRGAANHMAVKLRGTNTLGDTVIWDTQQCAADHIGVTIQSINQALRRGGKSKGWMFERLS